MKKMLWVVLFGALFLLALGHFLFFEQTAGRQLETVRQKLMATASYTARAIDPDLIFQVPLKLEGDSSMAYKTIFDKLSGVKEADPSIKYVYILTVTDQPGIMQFVVDADPLPEIFTAKGPSAFPGDHYDARGIPALLNGFKGPSADMQLIMDGWGLTLSGYAPIRDAAGQAVAIVGVDMDATPMKAGSGVRKTLLGLVAVTGLLFAGATIFFALKIFTSAEKQTPSS